MSQREERTSVIKIKRRRGEEREKERRRTLVGVLYVAAT